MTDPDDFQGHLHGFDPRCVSGPCLIVTKTVADYEDSFPIPYLSDRARNSGVVTRAQAKTREERGLPSRAWRTVVAGRPKVVVERRCDDDDTG